MSRGIEGPIGARVPADIELREYQKEAIASWVGENYRGIFDMATGTGKTLTGLGAISKLSEDLDDTEITESRKGQAMEELAKKMKNE